mmetsp:Transcript_34118/g.85440  ORF Transcript_34118/g.85440 Transcript_34118/m.85440 type:complete len:270 (-) Transcript_34118:93-902(-)
MRGPRAGRLGRSGAAGETQGGRAVDAGERHARDRDVAVPAGRHEGGAAAGAGAHRPAGPPPLPGQPGADALSHAAETTVSADHPGGADVHPAQRGSSNLLDPRDHGGGGELPRVLHAPAPPRAGLPRGRDVSLPQHPLAGGLPAPPAGGRHPQHERKAGGCAAVLPDGGRHAGVPARAAVPAEGAARVPRLEAVHYVDGPALPQGLPAAAQSGDGPDSRRRRASGDAAAADGSQHSHQGPAGPHYSGHRVCERFVQMLRCGTDSAEGRS